jgi:hypothetical protein
MNHSQRVISAGLIAVLLAGGCQQSGPASVDLARGPFNQVIQKTNNEQLLLNLVRLYYREPPYFLTVASVSTSHDLEISSAASGTFPRRSANSYGVGLGASYTEKPTVTYTPLHGDKFVKQLMRPVDAHVILLLYHSGWSVSRIFRLLLQDLNDLPNAPSATGPTPSYEPRYQEFQEACDLLRDLQKDGALDFYIAQKQVGEQRVATLEMRIEETKRNDPRVERLYELLNLNPDRQQFPLESGITAESSESIKVITRSLIACFFYVSQSVQPPAEDIRKGRVTQTRSADGTPFDWQQVTRGLMTIRSSGLPPSNAFVKVFYRGSWFYIDDSDLDAKSTFSLLMQLFALQAGDVKTTEPLLTLPVSR